MPTTAWHEGSTLYRKGRTISVFSSYPDGKKVGGKHDLGSMFFVIFQCDGIQTVALAQAEYACHGRIGEMEHVALLDGFLYLRHIVMIYECIHILRSLACRQQSFAVNAFSLYMVVAETDISYGSHE